MDDVPPGTSEKIRKRAIWAVALFAACVVPAIIGVGIINTTVDQANIATPFAFGLWVLGAFFAIAAAIPTLHHWYALSQSTRWLGALPMLCLSLFFSIALVVASLAGP